MADFLGDGVLGEHGLVGVAFLLELQIAELQDGGANADDLMNLFGRHAHDLHGFQRLLPFRRRVGRRQLDISLREELVRLEVLDDEFLLFLGRAAFEHLVENVE